MIGDVPQVGQLKHAPRVLLGPGPSNLHPRVVQAMGSPILGYMDPQFLQVMDETMALLRFLFQTRNELTITLPGTGMAGMEAAIANIVEPGDEVIVSPWTMCASATTILHWNAIPVFADIETIPSGSEISVCKSLICHDPLVNVPPSVPAAF